MRGLREKYEAHHGVRISDPAIVAAVELSNRYISERFLPDKAIDLIDEAAARLKTEADSKPEALDRLGRQLIQLHIEREAMRKENDAESKKRLAAVDDEIKKTKKESANLEEIWSAERARIQSAQKAQMNATACAPRPKKPNRTVIGNDSPNSKRRTAGLRIRRKNQRQLQTVAHRSGRQ